MLKKLCFWCLIILPFSFANAQEKKVDSTAVLILDRMSSIFGELKSLGFTSNISKDVVYAEDFFIKVFSESKVKLKGPDKFSVRVKGENKEDVYSYNGEQVIYYSYKNNIFSAADAPDNLIETIDWLYDDFGIELTTADFLYPSFSSDFLKEMEVVEMLGISRIGDKSAFHIAGSNSAMTVQLWISDDVYFLPMKILITYLDGPYAHQFQTDFSDWEINPDYPDSIFEFLPPPNATQITWMSQN